MKKMGCFPVSYHFLVDVQGVPRRITLDKSYGPVIDKDLLADLAEMRFRPATLLGKPVAVALHGSTDHVGTCW